MNEGYSWLLFIELWKILCTTGQRGQHSEMDKISTHTEMSHLGFDQNYYFMIEKILTKLKRSHHLRLHNSTFDMHFNG